MPRTHRFVWFGVPTEGSGSLEARIPRATEADLATSPLPDDLSVLAGPSRDLPGPDADAVDLTELALDKDTVVGFATATSDAVLSAYIPLLEVLPEYQVKESAAS